MLTFLEQRKIVEQIENDEYLLSRYRLAVSVLLGEKELATQGFRQLIINVASYFAKNLERKHLNKSYPLAIAFTVAVLERSCWEDTEGLRRIYASSGYVLKEEVYLCLTVDEFYNNMDDAEFNNGKQVLSVCLSPDDVTDLKRSEFVLRLFTKKVIEVGDISQIEQRSGILARYKKRYQRKLIFIA